MWNDRRRRLYLFCAVWMAVSIAPVLNLRAFSPLALVEDRYLYMASVAWCIAIAELAATYSAEASSRRDRLLAAATAIVTIACAGILFHVESFWHDEYALFSTCVEMSPRSSLCHDRLGVALKRARRCWTMRSSNSSSRRRSRPRAARISTIWVGARADGPHREALGELKRALAMLTDAPAGAYVEYAKLADSVGKTGERDEALHHAEELPGGVECGGSSRARS